MKRLAFATVLVLCTACPAWRDRHLVANAETVHREAACRYELLCLDPVHSKCAVDAPQPGQALAPGQIVRPRGVALPAPSHTECKIRQAAVEALRWETQVDAFARDGGGSLSSEARRRLKDAKKAVQDLK